MIGLRFAGGNPGSPLDEGQPRFTLATARRSCPPCLGNQVAVIFPRDFLSIVVARPAQLPARGRLIGVAYSVVGWLVCGPVANLPAATYQAGPWTVDVALLADQPTIMLGEPTWLSFTVTNRSADDLQILVGGDYQNELGRPGSFQVKTVRRDGKWVSQPDVGLQTGGLIGPKVLPAGGHYTFRLFVPHWATFRETGSYTISCRRTLQLLRPPPDGDFRKVPLEDIVTDARTILEVQPPDHERMERLVQELGETMLRAEGNKPGDEAVVSLAWIDDSRVVPYFRRALDIRVYALKFVAVHAVAKFATDEALEVLKTAMRTTVSDFDYASGEQQPGLAANIRTAAARALTRCRHPRAREELIAQRHNEMEGVRIAVVHAVARMPPAEAVPLLQEMTRDQSEHVSGEAKRYLAVLLPQPSGRAAKP